MENSFVFIEKDIALDLLQDAKNTLFLLDSNGHITKEQKKILQNINDWIDIVNQYPDENITGIIYSDLITFLTNILCDYIDSTKLDHINN